MLSMSIFFLIPLSQDLNEMYQATSFFFKSKLSWDQWNKVNMSVSLDSRLQPLRPRGCNLSLIKA